MQKYTKTTSRTTAWIKRVSDNETLILAAPYQRNPVWTEAQQGALIETILLEYPIPELYMQDIVDSEGREQHIVVDGQQRVRAVLNFLEGDYAIVDPQSRWADLSFDDMSPEDKKRIYEYDFVVRQLPEMPDEQIRSIFQRINRTNVTLNNQELRHATYWGPFIKLMEEISDLEFWETSGIFSANDRRRMMDTEFVSELAVAYLNGIQNKKTKLEEYYRIYEIEFDREAELRDVFFSVLGEIYIALPDISKTRWRKKSDFYSLFIALSIARRLLPLSSEGRLKVRDALLSFGEQITSYLAKKDGQEEPVGLSSAEVAVYAHNVERAASDIGSRRQRNEALMKVLLPIFRAETGGEVGELPATNFDLFEE